MKKEIDIEFNVDFYLAVIVAILILAGIWATSFYLSVKLILTALALLSFREFNHFYGSSARQLKGKETNPEMITEKNFREFLDKQLENQMGERDNKN